MNAVLTAKGQASRANLASLLLSRYDVFLLGEPMAVTRRLIGSDGQIAEVDGA